MILWSLDVRSPPLDVVAVHRVGEPLVTPLVWRTLSCYLLPVILLSVARGVCVYSNASNHRCKLRDFLDSTRCDFAVSDQLYLEKSARVASSAFDKEANIESISWGLWHGMALALLSNSHCRCLLKVTQSTARQFGRCQTTALWGCHQTRVSSNR